MSFCYVPFRVVHPVPSKIVILIITTNVLHVFLLNTFPLSICGSANPFDTGVLARLGVKIEITQGFFPILYTVGVYFQCSKAF